MNGRMFSLRYRMLHRSSKHLLYSISSISWPPLVQHQMHVQWNLQGCQPLSQAVGKIKAMLRTRDHGFDDYMEVCKKVRKVLKFQDLILSQPDQAICVARLDTLARRLGMKMYESGAFVLKFPHIFEIFEHPVQRLLWCRVTKKALQQIEEEKRALAQQEEEAVIRLRKLLMISAGGRVRLEHIRLARQELGLPDDLEFSIILKYPQYFRLIDASESRMKYVEILERDPRLAVCAIERVREEEYRERGKKEEDIRFSFVINFPPGFKLKKHYKLSVLKWQKLPYWSPYEDISSHDLRSLESQKRLEKRVVATIHEFLSITVEKKISLERIAHFKQSFNLPNKLKNFLLQHQGIFYISTRGNQGKLHTIFLREAYKKGELVEPNALYVARRKLIDLILLSPRKATFDDSLAHSRRDRDDENAIRNYIENVYKSDAILSGKETSEIRQDDDDDDATRQSAISCMGRGDGVGCIESDDGSIEDIDIESDDGHMEDTSVELSDGYTRNMGKGTMKRHP